MIADAFYVDGKVAVYYFQPMPKWMKVNGKDIIFDCQHGIPLAFVDESDVPALLAAQGGCCGGKRQIVFLANSIQYSHWLNGQGGR